MDLNELQAVAAVHLYNSYARAAKGMDVPVSTLSKRITRVEDELGVKLFNRSSANALITLTDAGETLLPLIHKLMNTNRFMLNHVEGVKGAGSNRITVGSTTTLADKGDGRIIADFMHDNPDVEVVSVVRSQNEMIRFLVEGRVDCAFLLMTGDESSLTDMWETFSGGRFESITLRSSDTMWIAMSAEDPLSEKDEISIDDLRYRRIIFTGWDNKERTPKDEPKFFKTLGVNPDGFEIGFEDFINPMYVFDLVRLGAGVLPQAFLMDEKPIEDIRYVKLSEWKRPTSILYAVRKFRTGKLEEFTRYVAQAAQAAQEAHAS